MAAGSEVRVDDGGVEREITERLGEYLARRMRADGTPGAVVALTDRDRLLGVVASGVADLAAGTPLDPGALFALGSIGKCFTAVAVLQLEEAGLLDLHAPVDRYLRWFRVGGKGSFPPITTHHLLSSTAGIIAGMDGTVDAASEAWTLRRLAPGSAPGERFHYSNIGYKVLGLLVERLTGEPYGDAIRRGILAPLGMDATEPAMTHAMRPRMVVGHAPLYDDRPSRRDDPLVPAPWVETDTGDGCLAAPAADVAAFLRMLLNRGRGSHGPILTEASYERMVAPVTDSYDGKHGYGIFVGEGNGRTELDRPGYIPGFGAWLRLDPAAGLGAAAFVNGPGSPYETAGYALDLLRAAWRGEALPPIPEMPEPTAVANAADYAGVYLAPAGSDVPAPVLDLAAAEGRLLLGVDGDHVALEWYGEDAFLVPHPAFARFALRFGREEDRVVEAVHGGAWWGAARQGEPRTWTMPRAWAGYVGHYRSYSPWIPSFRVVARKGALWLIFPEGPDGFDEEQPLVPDDSGRGAFRVGADERGPERIRFDTLVDGRALRATLSGAAFHRFFTP